MTDRQPYHHEDGTPWTGDELATELRARGLTVGGTNADKLARLDNDDLGPDGPEAGDDPVNDPTPKPDRTPDDGPEPDVSSQWATYARLDGSQYLVCLGDVSEVDEAQRPRTEPENDTDRLLGATLTP